ncbi:uncharacterized protein N7469_001070 [Penicillium citrinum]|uniref:Rhodopsin domain-containing protein n=1 Tax=Penicillium citrinum TaxID=5077 RepID=A0A9W9PGU9_PENCI|nr:uncharacterized protein N7469_001070 [Penicillium citrinum]KAJ5242743.1 hypothetical protein N7469_001070 [Penicillium citrinum]
MADQTITPAMAPPAGKVSNFVNPAYAGTKFVVVNCVFLTLAVSSLCIRTWTRLFVVRSFRWDDYLMLIALILSCVLTAVTLDMLNWGLGKHMWDVPLKHLTPHFLKRNVIAAILYCASTGFTKCSVLIFYLRIFPSRNFHIAVWTIVFIAAGYSFASILANILSCSPVAMAWDLQITKGHCMNRPVFYFANAGLGIFTDFATVIVPIPWLRRLQMPLRQKLAVGAILAMGCFVGIVSCIRLATLYTLLESPDLTWVTTDALMWCAIELNLGIFGGCITAIRPFIRRYVPRLLGLSSGGYSTSRTRKYGHPLGSIPRSERPDFTNGENQYSATLTTARGAHDNGSEEHILSTSHSGANNKEMDGSLGIVRTVEFDVENSSTSVRKHPRG